jgi:uncharacterized membrane protein
MRQSFQVIFSGRLKPGAEPEQVARDFAALFKVDEAQARALIDEGTERVLKRDVDAENAARYRDILDELGMQARIESRSVEGAASDAEIPMSEVPGEPDIPGAAPTPRRMPAAHGWLWIGRAWEQFKRQPWGWVGALALVYLITFVLGLIPFIGSLATVILGPVFVGGLMAGARAQEDGARLGAAAAFEGFSRNGVQLALVGVLYLFAIMAVLLLAGFVVLGAGLVPAASFEAMSSEDPELVLGAMAAVGPGLLILLLLVMLLTIPVVMAYWFAPALVVLDGLSAAEAMRTSLRACWANIVPFLVYGLVMMAIVFGSTLAVGLVTGLVAGVAGAAGVLMTLLLAPLALVFAAVVVLSMYTGYRDVFHGPGERSSAAF